MRKKKKGDTGGEERRGGRWMESSHRPLESQMIPNPDLSCCLVTRDQSGLGEAGSEP